MTDPQSISITLPQLKLTGLRYGPATGRPVLALHGWLDNASSFSRLCPLLVNPPDDGSSEDQSLQIVALDLPGHGLSDHRTPSAPYEFVYWVRDVIEAADALGWSSFSIIGHSMGGNIGLLVAGAFQDRIEQLVLLDTIGPFVNAADEMPDQLRESLSKQSATAQTPPTMYKSREAAIEHLMSANSALERTSATILAERGLEHVPEGYRWRYDPRVRQPSLFRLTEQQVEAFIRRCKQPTLLVRPDDGWPFPASIAEQRRQLFPNIISVQVPGSHHVHLNQPDQIAPIVREFLLE